MQEVTTEKIREIIGAAIDDAAVDIDKATVEAVRKYAFAQVAAV
jgi:hypothetical protein